MGSLLSHVLDPDHFNNHVILFSVIGVLLVTLLVKYLTGGPTNLPPGPRPLPFLGNVLDLAARPKHAHITFNELAKQYGDVMGLRIFNQRLVVLSSVEVMKEAFHKNTDVFSNRPDTYLISLAYKKGRGIAWQGHNMWRPIRRFTLTALKDLGVGKKSMDEKVMEESTAFAKVFSEHGGKPFDPSAISREAMSNVICNVCYGSRFEYNDKVFRRLVDIIDKNMSTLQLVEPIDFIPILQWLPLSPRLKELLCNVQSIDAFNMSQIDEHRLTYDQNNPRDFIDLYLDKEAEGPKEEEDLFSEVNMNNIIRDLFFAGSETTASTLRWGLLYLISYPAIQTRISNEIDEVVGTGVPTTAHKTELKYLQAFIMEVLRIASVAPSALPHLCEADTTIGGYTIPAGTTILGNIYSIHMSERYWVNPQKFNPERFLDAKGELLPKKEGFMSFGTGSRQCIGETMARTTLFLMFASLIQKFTFKMADEANPPPIQGSFGITLAPDAYKLRAIPK